MRDSVLPGSEEKPAYVHAMFARIAPTYDLVNRLMTLGQDQRWRRALLRLCEVPPHGALLDVGAGTGDLAREAKRLFPTVSVVAADFTYEMMAAGIAKRPGLHLPFAQADVNHLPYADGVFDAVVSGFLVRNVVDRTAAFREMARVTKPGGRVACLETTPPEDSLVGQGSALWFRFAVPLLGTLVSGDRSAYTYLPQSTAGFVTPAELTHHMEAAGLLGVFHRTLMFGAVAIHAGTVVRGA